MKAALVVAVLVVGGLPSVALPGAVEQAEGSPFAARLSGILGTEAVELGAVTGSLRDAVVAWDARLGIARSPGALDVLHSLDPTVAERVSSLLFALLAAEAVREDVFPGLKMDDAKQLAGYEGSFLSLDGVDPRPLQMAALGLVQAADAFADFPRIEASTLTERVPPRVNLPPVLVLDPDGVDNLYDRDAVLALDFGGNDLYDMNAGGSWLSVFLAGAPPECQTAVETIAASVGVGCENEDAMLVFTVAMAIDLAGDDHYGVRKPPRAADAFCTDEPIVRRVVTQGAGSAGIGILLEYQGNDVYDGRTLAQGHGHSGGVGILADFQGDDRYTAIRASQGSGLVAGTGVLYDGGGNDAYSFEAPMGGVFNTDLVKCDATKRIGLGAGILGATGHFLDEDGNDVYRIDAQGVGYGALGVGTFIDLGGGADDYGTYPGRTNDVLAKEGTGLFLDR